MKKINLYFIASLGIGALSFPCGATAQLHQSTVNNQNSYHSSVIDDEDDEDEDDEDEDEDDEDEDEDDEYDEDEDDEDDEDEAQVQIEKDKYDILRRDQIDPTSSLAIPFDDSEVEDELEVNAALKRRAFKVPEPPQPHHSK